MADTIKFIIPGKPEYLTMVRLALGSIADTAGFDLEEIEEIILMDRIISDQRDIMPLPDTLTQV